MSAAAILVIEDHDQKFAEVALAIRNAPCELPIDRAGSLLEAEDRLMDGYALLILDISMGIGPTTSGFVRGGHADLGGLEIVDHMYLNEISVPVIVVTGLDYFRLHTQQGVSEMIGLADLTCMIRERIGDQLIEVVRFGSAGWTAKLAAAVRTAAGSTA